MRARASAPKTRYESENAKTIRNERRRRRKTFKKVEKERKKRARPFPQRCMRGGPSSSFRASGLCSPFARSFYGRVRLPYYLFRSERRLLLLRSLFPHTLTLSIVLAFEMCLRKALVDDWPLRCRHQSEYFGHSVRVSYSKTG